MKTDQRGVGHAHMQGKSLPRKGFLFLRLTYILFFSVSFIIYYSFLFSSEDVSCDIQSVTRNISYCSVLDPFKFPL